MDREKLIEAIRLSIARVLDFKTDQTELECLADHLIANGIGDITAEKHRADVAEEALKLACQQIGHELHLFGVNRKIIVEPRIIEFKEQAEESIQEREANETAIKAARIVEDTDYIEKGVSAETVAEIRKAMQHLGRQAYGVLGTRGNRWLDWATIDEVRITEDRIILIADDHEVNLGVNWFVGYDARNLAKSLLNRLHEKEKE